jgi:hypothetical protein
MKIEFERNLLREPPGDDLAAHFKLLLRSYEEQEISLELFRLAEQEAIPPTTVAVWLGVSKSPEAVLLALKQEFSISIRQYAVKAFGKALHNNDWRKFWEGVGGTAGVLELLTRFSVNDVNYFFGRLRKHIRSTHSAKGRLMTELVQGINPGEFPEARIKTSDERPIYNLHSNLQLCDDTFVKENLNLVKDWNSCYDYGCVRSHYQIFRDICFKCNDWDDLQKKSFCLEELTQSIPSLPSPTRGFSASMEFSVELLREIVSRPGGKFFDGPNIWNFVVSPLLKRAWNRRRRIGWDQWRDILLLCLKFLDTRPDSLYQLRPYEHRGITYYMILSWAYCPSNLRPTFESILTDLLHRFPDTEGGIWNHISLYLTWVRRSMKYPLLKLGFMYISNKSIDVERAESLKSIKPGPWPVDWFLDLERDNALRLLKRLRDIYVDGFLSDNTKHTSILNSVQGDKVHILLGILGDSEVAEKEFEKSMKQTMQSRDQDERSEFGAMTICYAIATGSPATLERALNWGKRFIKDPLTSRGIFSWILIREESIGLLSGIPQAPDRPITSSIDDIKSRVSHSNKIIYLIIELFCLAIKEPFFNFRDWSSPLMVFTHVVEERMKRTISMLKDLKLSVDDVYAIVWKPTVSMAIQIEKLSMEPSYEGTFQFAPYGAIKSINSSQIPAEARLPCLRFVDELARERDQLWTPHRILNTPAVTVLPKSLRYGLPIQYMFAESVAFRWAAGATPFLFDRAKAAVFPDPDEMLTPVPEDEEVREAVNQFVDNYSIALKLYVHQAIDTEEWSTRIQKAFDYAIDHLSLSRMDEEEASSMWREIFNPLGYFPKLKVVDRATIKVEAFQLSSDIDSGETLEWNPADNFTRRPGIEPRELKLTYLDYSIEVRPWSSSKSKSVPQPKTKGYKPQPLHIWDDHWIELLLLRDGLLISVLLYLDTFTKGPRSILTTTFPSVSDPRFPSLYLADEFLQQKDVSLNVALACFQNHHWKDFPPTLLFNVTKAALNALSTNTVDSEYANFCRIAYGLLKLLRKSDNPSLAIDLILESVLDRPKDSSWHRKLLTNSFFARLSPTQAQSLLRNFSMAIQNKLKQQTKRQAEKPTDTTSSTAPSNNSAFVKVTTIKQLAQLLNDSVYVKTDFAIDILIDLLKNGNHVDIRVSVMQSLLQKLQLSNDAQAEKILSGLESLIAVAGDVNERTPLSDRDWAEAEAHKEPPEIQYAMVKGKSLNRQIPPVLTAVFQASNARYVVNKSKEWRCQIATRILYPALKRSVLSNTRWLKIFAKKYDQDLDSLNVPMLPVFPELLTTILNQSAWKDIPAFLARLHHRFIMTNLAPSRKLQEFNKSLNEPSLRSNPEICHWLALYGRQSEYHKPQNDNLLWDNVLFRRLHAWKPKHSLGEDCLPLSELRERCLAQAKVLSFHYGDSTRLQDFLAGTYARHDQDERYDVGYDPLGGARPVVERVVAYVDSLRTPKWQRNPDRVPAVLPPTLVYKLWLIPRPFPQPDDPNEAEKNITRCTDALRKALHQIATSGTPYRHDLAEVEKFVRELHKYYKAAIACELGQLKKTLLQLKKTLLLEDYLAIQLAEVLFKNALPPRNPSVTQRTRKLIQSWQMSSSEMVRLKGRELGQPHVYQNWQWRDLLFGKDGEAVTPSILASVLDSSVGDDKGWDEDDMSDTFDDIFQG